MGQAKPDDAKRHTPSRASPATGATPAMDSNGRLPGPAAVEAEADLPVLLRQPGRWRFSGA